MKKEKIKKPNKQKLIELMFKGKVEKLVKNYRLQVVKDIFDDLEKDLALMPFADYSEFVNFIAEHRQKQITINALEEDKGDIV